MKTLAYPAMFKRAPEGGFEVTFPDFPEAFTQGENPAEAIRMAIDCLDIAIGWRIERREKLPIASRRTAKMRMVPVSLDLAPKFLLYTTMRDQKISGNALAKRLGIGETEVRRMLDPKHSSKPGKYQAALLALGVTPQLNVADS
jgi:antitoxin HicB